MQRPVWFYSSGLKLAGDLYLPETGHGAGGLCGVVLCQGFGSTRAINLPAIAQWLAAHGYGVLTFDYRGFGESEGARWRLMPDEQVIDVRNAITFLQSETGFDPNRIVLFGVSFGGANVIQAAGLDRRARAVVSAVGFGDGDRWMRAMRRYWEYAELLAEIERDRVHRVRTGQSAIVDPGRILVRDPEAQAWQDEIVKQFPSRTFTLPLETAEAILEFRPEQHLPQIAGRPIMFVRASRDVMVPPDESIRMYELASEPKRMLNLDGVEHHGIYSGQPLADMMCAVDAWLREHLG